MKVLEINDCFNPLKIWVIKKTKCRHFYVNQKIAGRLFYRKFQKMTKKQLIDTGLKIVF